MSGNWEVKRTGRQLAASYGDVGNKARYHGDTVRLPALRGAQLGEGSEVFRGNWSTCSRPGQKVPARVTLDVTLESLFPGPIHGEHRSRHTGTGKA